MNPGAWIWIALGAAFVGGLLSSLQHAMTDLSRSSLEALAARRTLRRRTAEGSGPAAMNGDPGSRDLPGLVPDRVRHDTRRPRRAHRVGRGPEDRVQPARGRPRRCSTSRGCARSRQPGAVAVSWSGSLCGREAREAELLSLVEESEREGDLDESAREMIEAVVEFRSTTVEQIMTPRTDIQGFEYTDDLEAVKSVGEFDAQPDPGLRRDLDQHRGRALSQGPAAVARRCEA
jgi:hypothetical protein